MKKKKFIVVFLFITFAHLLFSQDLLLLKEFNIKGKKEIKKVKINTINQKLDALTRDMLMNQQDNFKTLAQMNEIKGLIIDFLSE